MNNLARAALEIAQHIQKEVPRFGTPPSETVYSPAEMVFPNTLVKDTRDYVEKVAFQINGAYASGWYDACAVMIRRLIETLIIECFESYKIEEKIKTQNDEYLHLGDLITQTLGEKSWTIGRNAKAALPRLKSIGDLSAHSRRYIAHREDVDKVIPDIRCVVQELVYLARLK
ncbi:MAG: hypothetical protein ABR886_12655 [Dehalococcoidales bacterium]|jgi:hypothetical protein